MDILLGLLIFSLISLGVYIGVIALIIYAVLSIVGFTLEPIVIIGLSLFFAIVFNSLG